MLFTPGGITGSMVILLSCTANIYSKRMVQQLLITSTMYNAAHPNEIERRPSQSLLPTIIDISLYREHEYSVPA